MSWPAGFGPQAVVWRSLD